MKTKLIISIWVLLFLPLPTLSQAQSDVTQFLGIPVDGTKSEMVRKLTEKGFTPNPYSNDVLDGEFNGRDVRLVVVTNNNRVWRIAVSDVYPVNEETIKIRYNNLLEQFNNNQRYRSTPDSTLQSYMIPDREDISYERLVNKKRYQAVFFQKVSNYDSLQNELDSLRSKKEKESTDFERVLEIMLKQQNFDKLVWFEIAEQSGKYVIRIFYDNELNRPNGDDL